MNTSKATQKNLVSIITPAYNSAPWIRACIESVQAQTYTNWEQIVVIDSGTTDNTAEIVQEISDKDPRIKLYRITNGKGLALARNTAIQNARGQFVAFLDSDDIWISNKLTEQVQFMILNSLDMSCCGFRRVSDDLVTVGFLQLPPQNITYWKLLANNRMACLTVMIDQSKVGEFQFQEIYHEDFLLWLSLLKKGFKCQGLQKDLARYRILKNSRSANKLKMIKVRWKILREYQKLNFIVSTFYLMLYGLTSLMKYKKF